ncbi:MAG: hypothetical protein WBO06_15120 [Gammaproteobacteria bacterium]
MLFIIWYTIVPLVFVFGCLVQSLRKPGTFWRRAGNYGLLAYLVSFTLGAFAILESRSSTSGIGFLFLPMIAVVPGVLGFGLGAARHRLGLLRQTGHPTTWPRIWMVVALIGLVGALAVQLHGWHDTRQLNQSRDQEVERQRAEIKANKRTLAARLAAAPGREAQIIEQLAAETDDRTWLLPLASNPHTSALTLDRLSQSADLGVALSALRHVNVPSEAIVRVYRTHSYPDYFFSTMAGNVNTPAWLLAELYQKRAQNYGIALALAGNPNTQAGILDKLLAGTDPRILKRLVENPALSCAQLHEVQVRLQDEKTGRLDSSLAKALARCREKGTDLMNQGIKGVDENQVQIASMNWSQLSRVLLGFH